MSNEYEERRPTGSLFDRIVHETTPGRRTRAEDELPKPAPKAHVLPEPVPGEPEQVASARAMLLQVEHDPNRLLLVLRRILEAADLAEPRTASQLLHIARGYTDEFPALVGLIRQRLSKLDHVLEESPKHAASMNVADAQRFNASHSANVAAFLDATHLASTPAELDVERVAMWQRAHGLEPDGKIGSATVGAARKEHSTKEQNPDAGASNKANDAATAAASGGGGGGGGGGGIQDHGPSGKHEPPESVNGLRLLARDPALADQQKKLRLQQYDEDENKRGYVPPRNTNVTVVDIYNGIHELQPRYEHELIVMMVGHVRAEQGDQCLNYNFAGMEPYWHDPPTDGTPWTRGLRSAFIDAGEYRKRKVVYLNWLGHTAIEDQLAANPNNPHMGVMFYGPRPAYSSTKEAVSKFVANINKHLVAFEKTGSPVATNVHKGNAHAYYQLVHDPAPDGSIGSYNEFYDEKHIVALIEKAQNNPELEKLRGK